MNDPGLDEIFDFQAEIGGDGEYLKDWFNSLGLCESETIRAQGQKSTLILEIDVECDNPGSENPFFYYLPRIKVRLPEKKALASGMYKTERGRTKRNPNQVEMNLRREDR